MHPDDDLPLTEAILETSTLSEERCIQLATSHLDALTNRLQAGELSVLAGRPGTGNSTVAMHLALEWGLRQKRPVHVYSNQSGLDHWVGRLARIAANLGSQQYFGGQLNAAEQTALKNAAKALDQAPITLHRELFMPPECLHTHIAETVPKGQTQTGALILIDYLQWNGRDHHVHVEQLAETLRDLQQMAQTLQASVMLLANLHRALEMRPDKRPRMCDLPLTYRQTEAVDQVWLLYRHGLYVKDQQVPSNHVNLLCHHLHTLKKAKFGVDLTF